MALVIDGTLSATALRAQSSPEDYAAGEEAADFVEHVFVEPGRAGGVHPEMAPAIVVVEWSRGRLKNSCPCRRRGVSTLCQHVVAVGLAALDHARPLVQLPQTVEPSPTQRWLAELSADELRQLVLDLAATGPDAAGLMDARVAGAAGDAAADAAGDAEPVDDDLLEVLELIYETLVPGDYLDDADSMMVAEDAVDLLDDLEALLDEGPAERLLEPLRRTLTLLRDIQESADDGAGALLGASQRAADLYARACSEGHPDGPELARWLAQFRSESMVAPMLGLEAFAPALGDAGLAAYRTAVATQHRQRGRAHPEGRREIERMVLELADHDGDVETAVAVLGHTDNPPYGAMLARLDAVGRIDEALRVVDLAVAAGRVSLRRNGLLDEARLLDPGDVGFRYLAAGRPDDALRALRGVFQREPSDASYQALLGSTLPGRRSCTAPLSSCTCGRPTGTATHWSPRC